MTNKDLIKVGKGALLAGGGAVLTYLIEIIPSVELGDWTPIVVAMFSVLLNVIRKSSGDFLISGQIKAK